MPKLTWTVPPPCSCRIGDRDLASLLPQWQHQRTSEPAPGGTLEHHVWSDPDSGLRLLGHVRWFPQHDAVEWMLEAENTGAADTPILADLLPLDLTVTIPGQEQAFLHYAKGSQCRMDDFLPQLHAVSPRSRIALAPEGGRSSNGVLPFMNLHHGEGGAVLAVGWSGQWQAVLDRQGEALRITAGMQTTHLRLHPGERIRTPRILLVNYAGRDPQEGNNALRRLLLAHYLPRLDGELVLPPVAQCLQFYYYLTGDMNADIEMQCLPKVADLGATAYWIDACWYGQGRDWWQEVGNWTINRKRYPQGLRPIADAAHQRGMKFVLWFEPARVRRDGQLAREHPQFVLPSPRDPDNLLLDFGNPQARQHLLDLFAGIIEESGVDIYREDFNFDPLAYWQAADAPDRVGMAEIRYITGHYEFWDSLRQRFPRLAIDNCASGGRRIDLETMSRSLPLWPSDFHDIGGLSHGQGLHLGDQCINAGLARWVVLLGGGVWDFTPYGTRSELIGGWTFGMHIDPADFPPDHHPAVVTPQEQLAKGKRVIDRGFPTRAAQAAIAEWKSLRPYFLGDFYLLLPLTVAAHDSCAYQFHRREQGDGFALLLRRHQSPYPAMTVSLRGVTAEATYEVSLSRGFKESPRRRMSGADLLDLRVSIAEAPGSMLLRYSRV